MDDTFHIQWHITDECNFRCRHCYQDDFSVTRTPGPDRLRRDFENITEFLAARNLRLVVDVTGGEPFLHDNLAELLRMLDASPTVQEIGIITNGFFLAGPPGRILRDFPETHVRISSEGVEAPVYERYRGRNRYPGFLEALKFLSANGRETTLMFTLLEDNADQIPKLLPFAREQGIGHVVVERFMPWGRGGKSGARTVTAETWKETVRTLLRISGNGNDLSSVLPYRAFKMDITATDCELSGAPCIVGKDGCAVMPDGTIFPCRRFPLAIGNLRDRTMEHIWKHSAVLKRVTQRAFLKGRCGTCGIPDCLGCRAMAYATTGDFLAEDPLCFLEKV